MVVGGDSTGLAQCIDSVRPFVSSFVVFDADASGRARSLANGMLAAIKGQIVPLDAGFSDDPVPLLYEMAADWAEYVLFLHPDEVFRSIRQPVPAPVHDAVVLEVDYGRCSFIQPRLIRSGRSKLAIHPFRAAGDVAETFSFASADYLRLSKQASGDHAFRSCGRSSWHLHLERRASIARTSADCVELAIHCSRQGDLDGARNWLQAGLEDCNSRETEWQLHYLLGLSRLQSGDKTGATIGFARAFDLDPDRLEPLYRLIRIKLTGGDLQSAIQLSRLALDLEFSWTRGYLERRLYERERYIQHFVILERLKAFPEAEAACNALLKGADLAVDLRRFLEKSGERYRRLLYGAPKDVSEKTARDTPLLTLGMAVVDDYDGVYFTVMSLRLYHRECLDRLEFLIIDNNPGGDSAAATRRFCENLGMRYLPVSDYRSTAVRDSIFRHASGRFVLCLDAHVMLLPGALAGLIEYIEDNAESPDLLQGPLVNDRGDRLYTHLEKRWKDGMYGTWAQTEGLSLHTSPFEIPMQGLGLFCCRRDAWPGLNPRFTGFGGEEGYLHEKFRRSGGRILCLPFLQWVHRFERPLGIPYRINWRDRIRNYLIGHDELGWDTLEMATHFARVVGFEEMSRALSDFSRERKSPLFKFDGIFVLDHPTAPGITEEMSARFLDLGISCRIRRIALTSNPDDVHSRAAVRRLLDSSIVHGLKQVLVISSLELLPNDLEEALACILSELEHKEWSICFLGLQSDHANDSFSEAVKPGLVRIHHESSDNPIETLASGGTFLANLEMEKNWLNALRSLAIDSESTIEPANADNSAKSQYFPRYYAVCPPVTVRRDRFVDVDNPARYYPIRQANEPD